MVIETINERQWSPRLLAWFAQHRRDLPWRTEPRDPYHVWVAEIMLQQTKVEAVRPYYENWLHVFPTMEALAAAEPDEVLRQWQGLGYYSRARNLHAAVREVMTKYGGTVPQTAKEIRTLKGIGEYTAGAILSIAYGQDETAVDGNVLRIFARVYGIARNILSGRVKKEITQLVAAQLPTGKAGMFNEALMDFGAMVCIPKTPHCEVCPLMTMCRAYCAGREKELPIRVTRKKVPVENRTVVMIRKQGAWLIHRRPPTGLLASMWEFPNVPGKGPDGREAVRQLLAQVGGQVAIESHPLATREHVFSHKKWRLTIYAGTWCGGTLLAGKEWQWLPIRAYTTVPWAGPHGKLTALEA